MVRLCHWVSGFALGRNCDFLQKSVGCGMMGTPCKTERDVVRELEVFPRPVCMASGNACLLCWDSITPAGSAGLHRPRVGGLVPGWSSSSTVGLRQLRSESPTPPWLGGADCSQRSGRPPVDGVKQYLLA